MTMKWSMMESFKLRDEDRHYYYRCYKCVGRMQKLSENEARIKVMG